MRLKEIEKILINIDLNASGLTIRNFDHSSPDIDNINKFKEFLEKIEEVEIYKKEIEFLKKSSLYKTTSDTLEMEKKVAHDILKTSKYLIDSASSLKLVFNKLLPESNEQSISIKLPEPADFEALNKTMTILHKSISQIIVNDTIKGSTKINNWEHGSFWIELILGTQAAVGLVASVAWSAAVISKKFNENKILEQTVRAMELKNDSLEDILEKQKIMTTSLIENEAQAILDNNFANNDFEQLERLKSSIKTFATLIQNGAEIHPSLIAQEKVQNLFPNFKDLDMITSKIAQIEDKSKHKE
jgi:hypothetical protein